MNKKQTTIFRKICNKFNISFNQNSTFIQHRNLNEFRSFSIEKLNPTHKIQLYGKLKKKHIHDGYSHKIIKVGEIIALLTMFSLNQESLAMYIICNALLCLILSNIFYYLMITEVNKDVNWHKWLHGFWKNCLNGEISKTGC